ncbi:hypothetical protein CYMTET_37214 [Cymbomonas tetramitiformis]|uniref:Uncharacterized protein n=1 Tax=Cymbomonas tetramitiformis TaxID=36881 RepID=A0AAE0CFZ0_9CHLO|nr:hypothetical protein CYMTET_37214 [Cymbomonas tetramitiformis]
MSSYRAIEANPPTANEVKWANKHLNVATVQMFVASCEDYQVALEAQSRTQNRVQTLFGGEVAESHEDRSTSSLSNGLSDLHSYITKGTHTNKGLPSEGRAPRISKEDKLSRTYLWCIQNRGGVRQLPPQIKDPSFNLSFEGYSVKGRTTANPGKGSSPTKKCGDKSGPEMFALDRLGKLPSIPPMSDTMLPVEGSTRQRVASVEKLPHIYSIPARPSRRDRAMNAPTLRKLAKEHLDNSTRKTKSDVNTGSSSSICGSVCSGSMTTLVVTSSRSALKSSPLTTPSKSSACFIGRPLPRSLNAATLSSLSSRQLAMTEMTDFPCLLP